MHRQRPPPCGVRDVPTSACIGLCPEDLQCSIQLRIAPCRLVIRPVSALSGRLARSPDTVQSPLLRTEVCVVRGQEDGPAGARFTERTSPQPPAVRSPTSVARPWACIGPANDSAPETLPGPIRTTSGRWNGSAVPSRSMSCRWAAPSRPADGLRYAARRENRRPCVDQESLS